MSRFTEIDFSQFITLQRGYDLTKANIEPGPYPVVSSTSIMGYHNAFKVKGPGVVTGRSGTIGQVQYVEEDFWPHNTSLYVKDFKGNDPKFVYYFLKYFNPARRQTGSAVPTLNRNHLAVYKVKIPDFPMQQKIASVLSAYDDLIKCNRRQIALLEETAQRIFVEWFVKFRFPKHEESVFVNGIPEGWQKLPLHKVFTFVRGRSYTSEELGDKDGILLVNLKNIKAFGGYKRGEEKRYIGKYKEEQLLKDGDLIMGVTDMTQERRLVGHFALVPDLDTIAIPSMDLIKIMPFTLPKNTLFAIMHYGGYCKEIAVRANGTNVLHLRPENMMDIEILVPSDDVADAYDKYFERLRVQVNVLSKQICQAEIARDMLLPRLMEEDVFI